MHVEVSIRLTDNFNAVWPSTSTPVAFGHNYKFKRPIKAHLAFRTPHHQSNQTGMYLEIFQ